LIKEETKEEIAAQADVVKMAANLDDAFGSNDD